LQKSERNSCSCLIELIVSLFIYHNYLLFSISIRINFISSLKEMDPEFVAYLEGKGFSEADYRSWDLQRKEEWVDRYRAAGKNILL
jgi:hypothetical protein